MVECKKKSCMINELKAVCIVFQFDDHGVNAVCDTCRKVYRQMNKDFLSLDKGSSGHACMDLVDMVCLFCNKRRGVSGQACAGIQADCTMTFCSFQH